MSTSTRIPLEYAWAMSAALIDLLHPGYLQIEVADSIRRGKPDVGDIEIVCQPIIATLTQSTLFGGLLAPSPAEGLNLLDG